MRTICRERVYGLANKEMEQIRNLRLWREVLKSEVLPLESKSFRLRSIKVKYMNCDLDLQREMELGEN